MVPATAASRLLASGLAAATAQWALALASLAAMGLEPTTWWLAGSGVLAAAVSVLTYRLLIRPEPPTREGEGGGPPGDDPEPPWWPDFERAFRAHTERAREPA